MPLGAMNIDSDVMVAFAQALVRTPSLSTQEEAVATLLADAMTSAGFTVTTDDMGNVIGRIGDGDGPVLLFDGHMDTVGVGDADRWARDPYSGEVDRGVLYGRGASDGESPLTSNYLWDMLSHLLWSIGWGQPHPACNALAAPYSEKSRTCKCGMLPTRQCTETQRILLKESHEQAMSDQVPSLRILFPFGKDYCDCFHGVSAGFCIRTSSIG